MQDERRVDAVIFDLDGTLSDTMPILMQGIKDVAEEITGRRVAPEDVISRYGPPDPVVLAELIGADALTTEQEARYRTHVRELATSVRPLPGIIEMLSKFRAAGVRTGVYSARGTVYAQIITKELGLAPHLDLVWGGDAVDEYKPHPDGIVKMLAQFGVQPEAAAYVGDSANDLVAAAAAGVTGVLVLWSSTPQPKLQERADLVVHAARELERWVLGD